MIKLNLTKEIVFQPMVIVTLIIFLIWATVDFASRFLQEEVMINSTLDNVELMNEFDQILDDQQINQIQLLYKRYEPIIKPVKTVITQPAKKVPVGMSKEEQLLQQGLLKTVYIDDKKLELKAIVNDLEKTAEPLTALILVSDVKSNNKKIERFINKSLVYGYTLNIDKNTHVTLSRTINNDGKEYNQFITLTMYQTSK